jgi:hypothetical protein
MLRKFSFICAVAGALLFPVTTFAGEGENHHHQNEQDQRHAEHHDHDQDHWRAWSTTRAFGAAGST